MYIERDISEELELLDKIKDQACVLAEVLSQLDGVPGATYNRAARIANSLTILENLLKKSKTYLEIVDYETGKKENKYFSEGDYGIFYEASRRYAFSDLDDSCGITKIVFEGREVEYCGWDFGMHFVYKYKDTKEIAFENSYPQWDH